MHWNLTYKTSVMTDSRQNILRSWKSSDKPWPQSRELRNTWRSRCHRLILSAHNITHVINSNTFLPFLPKVLHFGSFFVDELMRFDQRQNELVQQLANTRSLPPKTNLLVAFKFKASNRTKRKPYGNHWNRPRNLNMESKYNLMEAHVILCKGRDQGPVNGHCMLNWSCILAPMVDQSWHNPHSILVARWKQSSENTPRGADCKAISPLPSPGLYRFLSIYFHRVFLLWTS